MNIKCGLRTRSTSWMQAADESVLKRIKFTQIKKTNKNACGERIQHSHAQQQTRCRRRHCRFNTPLIPLRLQHHSPSSISAQSSQSQYAWTPDQTLGASNESLLPLPLPLRSFTLYDFASLWIGLVVCVPAYTLAGSILDMGVGVGVAVGILIAGSCLLLGPMLINAHAGAKYGVPFPVLARSAFGIYGGNIISLLRSLVAAGWFGIQTWYGGEAIHTILESYISQSTTSTGILFSNPNWWPVAALGLSFSHFITFGTFWIMQVAILMKGMNLIRYVEGISAPILIILCSLLYYWATNNVSGGVSGAIALTSVDGGSASGLNLNVILPALTGVAGFWSSLAIGLPACMGAFGFMAIIVTACSSNIFGEVVTDPVQIVSRIGKGTPTFLAMIGVILATLSTNVAANVVGPANALVAMLPGRVSFARGAFITALLGIIVMPWKLVASSSGFIFSWLIGYSALLGPIAGIMVADYVRRGFSLESKALFTSDTRGPYYYYRGYNIVALAALLIGVLVNMPGFLVQIGVLETTSMNSSILPFFIRIYEAAWFVGFALGAGLYATLTPLVAHYRNDLEDKT